MQSRKPSATEAPSSIACFSLNRMAPILEAHTSRSAETSCCNYPITHLHCLQVCLAQFESKHLSWLLHWRCEPARLSQVPLELPVAKARRLRAAGACQALPLFFPSWCSAQSRPHTGCSRIRDLEVLRQTSTHQVLLLVVRAGQSKTVEPGRMSSARSAKPLSTRPGAVFISAEARHRSSHTRTHPQKAPKAG